MLHLDNTKRTTYISCPFKYQLQVLRHIYSTYGSTALRYGSVWHKAMEGFYKTIAEQGWNALAEGIKAGSELAAKAWGEESAKFTFNDDYRDLPNMMQAFIAYLDHYHGDEGLMDIVEPESTFKILITPTAFEQETFPGITPFYFTGQIDLKVLLAGRKWIKEHKTTGRSLTMQAATLNRSPQLIGYNYAQLVLSDSKEVPDGSLVSLHQIIAYKSKVTGNYGKPKFDFQRPPQIFSLNDLTLWRLSFVADAYQIQQSMETNIFPSRQHSCYTYGACTYINICEQSRPIGQEVLSNYFIDDDPWDVLKGKENTKEVKDEVDVWDERERKLYK